MNRNQRFRTNRYFWAWAIAGKDVDAELAKAMSLYRQRHNREPYLVFCATGMELPHIQELQIETRQFVPKGVLYFATEEFDA